MRKKGNINNIFVEWVGKKFYKQSYNTNVFLLKEVIYAERFEPFLLLVIKCKIFFVVVVRIGFENRLIIS